MGGSSAARSMTSAGSTEKPIAVHSTRERLIMPIEIRELVIHARVDPNDDRPATSVSAPAANAIQPTEALVQTCVKEVLRILEDKGER